jgi:hypothetical protein
MLRLPLFARLQHLAWARYPFQRPFNPLPPLGAARHCVLIGDPDVRGAILGHGFDNERGLLAVFFRP